MILQVFGRPFLFLIFLHSVSALAQAVDSEKSEEQGFTFGLIAGAGPSLLGSIPSGYFHQQFDSLQREAATGPTMPSTSLYAQLVLSKNLSKLLSLRISAGIASTRLRYVFYKIQAWSDPPNGTKQYSRYDYLSLNLDEATLEVAARVLLPASPVYVEGGLQCGLVVSQSARYNSDVSYGWESLVSYDPSVHSISRIGSAQPHITADLAVGASISVGPKWTLDVNASGRFGINRYFTDNSLRLSYSLEPHIGMHFAL